MANIKSQKKRIVTAEKARMRNKAVRSELKTAVKRVRAAVEANDAELAQAEANKAGKLLDKAEQKVTVMQENMQGELVEQPFAAEEEAK